MERSDLNMVAERLNVDVTDGTKRDATVGLKTMYETFALDLRVELLFDGDERLWINAITLIIALVINQILKDCLIFSWGVNRVGEQNSFRWQRLMCTGTDFSQHVTAMTKCNQVTGRCDINRKQVVFALKLAGNARVKQFGMNRSRKQMKIQIRDFRSNG